MTEKVSVVLLDELYRQVEDLVSRGQYVSRSEAIRQALQVLMDLQEIDRSDRS